MPQWGKTKFLKADQEMAIFFFWRYYTLLILDYDDVRMGAIASQITSLTIVYSIVYSDVDQRKHQSSPSLAFVRGIHRGPVNSPHKWPVTRKMFPCDDVIMNFFYWFHTSNLHHALGSTHTSIMLNEIVTFCCIRGSLHCKNQIASKSAESSPAWNLSL